ncbi:MAG TPA: hypothetical protein PK095_20950, partial [Myxococcota bacterium]|nr:hypothetical protein [Myxococcota bacterium]
PVSGATATLPLFADRVVMLPNAQLVLTEVDYEGVPRPPEPKADEGAAPGGAAPGPKKEPSKAEAFMQSVRASYLERFWAAVGKRLNEQGKALQAAIEGQGGRVITAQEALNKKVAHEVVSSLTTTRSANEKTELKVTTTRNKTRTAAPEEPGTN